MIESDNELIAYRIAPSNMKLAVSPPGRVWMNNTWHGFANRCLPMRMAGQAGWLVLNDRHVRAKWSGQAGTQAVVIESEGDAPYAAISHFGEGILTFVIPFLFRTSAGVSLLIRGPANMPKDAIAPLEALVETDWAVAGASVNWKFTRSDSWIEFARDEPICMIVPQRLDHIESFRPRLLPIQQDPQTLARHAAWNKSCKDFNRRLREHDPEAVRQGWLRNYLRGTAPHAAPDPMPEAEGHRTRLNLEPFEGSEPATPAQPAPDIDQRGRRPRSRALHALGICPCDPPDAT